MRRGYKPKRTRAGLGPNIKPYRSFDPRRVASLECNLWVSYYRHEWLRFLRSAIALMHHTFGLPWPSTIYGAWLVSRAIRLWSPIPDNDPDGARRNMARFYELLRRAHGGSFDPVRASELDVEWWREHREHGRSGDHGADEERLIAALAALYAYVYEVPEDDVHPAAKERVLAMRYSDRWVSEGCALESPLIDEERAALVRSYARLLAVVHRP